MPSSPKIDNSANGPEEEDDGLLKTERIRRAHEDRDRSRRKLSRKREKQVVKFESVAPEDLVAARVIRTEGAFFIARREDGGEEIRAKSYKGTRTENQNATLVAVGDRVRINYTENEDSIIEEVLPRKTKLSRKAAGKRDFEQVIVSNIDTLVIVASINEPPLRSGIIDRYVVAALDGGLSIVIAINKIDLASDEELEEVEYFRDVYSELGYPVFPVSTVSGKGVEPLRASLIGKTSVFAGHSGVGKSSIINAIFGKEVGRTGVLSKKYKRGAHTTTSSVLMPIEGFEHTYVVDTPGVREFANHELDPQNLKFYFVEFLPYQEHCRITNCSHIHEPECAVQQALEEDKISVERYMSYVKLFEEATAGERKRISKE